MDYMFLRRCNLALQECGHGWQFTKKNMACAIKITSPGPTLTLPEAVSVYDLALVFVEGI